MLDEKLSSATRVQSASGRQYHIGLAPGEVASNILLVGDPARAKKVAALLDSPGQPVQSREYISYRGSYRGVDISVLAHGISAENMEIAVIELCQCVERPTMIRCGSSGGLQPQLSVGDLVISRGCVRLESTSTTFVDPGYPALADHEVICALLSASEALTTQRKVYLGISASAGGFYGAQGRHIPPFTPRNPKIQESLVGQGVLNLEMESSCLLTLASLAQCRAGAICAVFANRSSDTFITPEDADAAEQAMLKITLEAFVRLQKMDEQRGERAHWHPDCEN